MKMTLPYNQVNKRSFQAWNSDSYNFAVQNRVLLEKFLEPNFSNATGLFALPIQFIKSADGNGLVYGTVLYSGPNISGFPPINVLAMPSEIFRGFKGFIAPHPISIDSTGGTKGWHAGQGATPFDIQITSTLQTVASTPLDTGDIVSIYYPILGERLIPTTP